MKTKIIFVIVAVLLFTQIPIIAFANNEIDYRRSTGYDRTLMEHVVELEYTVESIKNGTYEQDKQNIKQLKIETGNYFNTFKQDFEESVLLERGDYVFANWLWDYSTGAIEMGLKHGLENLANLWDYLKNRFKKDEINPELGNINDISRDFTLPNGLYFVTKDINTGLIRGFDTNYGINQIKGLAYSTYPNERIDFSLYMNDKFYTSSGFRIRNITQNDISIMTSPNSTFQQKFTVMNKYHAQETGLIYAIVRATDKSDVPVTTNYIPSNIDRNISNLVNNNRNQTNNYTQIFENNKPSMVLQLACNNSVVNAVYNAADDSYYAQGKKVTFNENGYVYLGTQECTYSWSAPVLTVDNNVTDPEEIVVKDGSGKEKTINEKNNEKPECDGVLCWLSSLWDGVKSLTKGITSVFDGLGELAKAIIAIPSKIIELLFDALKALFIPSDGFFSGVMDDFSDMLNDKFNTDSTTAIFDDMNPEKNAQINQGAFTGVKIDGLMGTGEVEIIDGDSINSVMDTIHSWIRGVFFILLAFFNINHLYRLIRGTTILNSWRGDSD